MHEPRIALLSGATGLVGGRLAADLLADGVLVRALTRDLRRASGVLDPRVVLVRWDGSHVPTDAVNGADAVVHLAGEPVFQGRLGAERRRRIRDSRVESTASLVRSIGALAPGEKPRVLVCASAVGFYGSRADQLLDEEAGPGTGFLADVCREWEAAAHQAESHGVRSLSLRIGVVLARQGGALPRLALPFRLGLGGRLGSGRQWFPWIQIDDLVSLIRAALRDERFRGPVNAVAPEPVRNAELARSLGKALGRPAFWWVPGLVLRAALGELAGELLDSRRVVPQRALDLGFRFRHPHIDGALAEEL